MIYAHRSDGVYVTYEGMTEDQVTAMLTDQGLTCTFIDQATYDQAISPLA